MFRLEFTKDELDFIRDRANFNKEETFIYDMMINERTLKEMECDLEEKKTPMSPSTISRRKKSVIKKIVRVTSKHF